MQSNSKSNHRPIHRVMLVDDDSTDNYLHKRAAEKSGLVDHVISFERAEEALQFLALGKTRVDVVCLDINMPRMDGFEFLGAFEKLTIAETFRPLILILSTSIRTEDIERASQISSRLMTASKPLSQETLNLIADNYLGTVRSEQRK